jgi:hypothetical protein
MPSRMRTSKIGDIYLLELLRADQYFMQYIDTDATQMESHIV